MRKSTTSKKIKFLIVMMLFFATAAMISVFIKESPIKENPAAKAFLEQQNHTSDNFWKTVPPPVKPKPTPRPIPKQPPKPKVKMSDLLSFNEAGVDPELQKLLDEQKARRDELIQQHRQPSNIKLFTYDTPKTGTSKIVYVDESEDFATGFEKITATFPVWMERILPMTSFIPAILVTEIRSNIGSDKVIAQVEQDVYGYHNRKILVPRGSKVVGKYKPLKRAGDTRIKINWYRILTPEGINIQLVAEVGDSIGSSGITGEIDHRWKDRYGQASLFATISALAQLSVPANNKQGAAAAEALTNELGTVTAAAIEEGLNIIPTVRIKRGTRLLVSPLADIFFKEPKGSFQKVSALMEKVSDPRNNYANFTGGR